MARHNNVARITTSPFRVDQTQGDIERLVNFNITQDGYWSNDVGFERLRHYEDGAYEYRGFDFEDIRFSYAWQKSGDQTYYLSERNGYLFYDYGNGTISNSRVFLDNTGERYIPASTETGTQAIEVNNQLILSNGHSRTKIFYGQSFIYDFGWVVKPSPPRPLTIDPSYAVGNVTFNQQEGSAVRLDPDGFYGITTSTEIGPINYGYKITFISSTGSESPMSDFGVLDFGIQLSEIGAFVAFIRIPVGPEGTVARRIYRTHMRRTTGEDDTVYLLKTVNDNVTDFISDHYPDELLLVSKEDQGVSVHTFHHGAIYDNRLWVAGGPIKGLRYSLPGQIESFRLLDYIYSPSSGSVTGMKAFEKYLLVFYEDGIEAIYKNQEFYERKQISNVGTTASDSIQVLPGLGVVYLSPQGFRVISSENLVSLPLGDDIARDQQRINTRALPRAVSVYNPISMEYWCHVPVDGLIEPTFGFVLHLPKRIGDPYRWSFRYADRTDHQYAMCFQTLCFDGQNTIIGAKPYDSADEVLVEDGTWHNVGLHVWSASGRLGTKLTNGALSGGLYGFDRAAGNTMTSHIESTWIDLKEPDIFKQVQSIEIVFKGSGHNLTLSYAQDEYPVYQNASTIKLVHPSYQNTSQDDSFYGTDVWDTAMVNSLRNISARWDLNTGFINSFKYKISTSSYIAFKSAVILLSTSQARTISNV